MVGEKRSGSETLTLDPESRADSNFDTHENLLSLEVSIHVDSKPGCSANSESKRSVKARKSEQRLRKRKERKKIRKLTKIIKTNWLSEQEKRNPIVFKKILYFAGRLDENKAVVEVTKCLDRNFLGKTKLKKI